MEDLFKKLGKITKPDKMGGLPFGREIEAQNFHLTTKFDMKTETSKNNETAQLGIGAVSSRTFEYRVIDHDMFDEDEIRTMNSMGSKGWEIIRILEPMKWLNSDGMFVRIYYKL